jgi:hypothetical protein
MAPTPEPTDPDDDVAAEEQEVPAESPAAGVVDDDLEDPPEPSEPG